MPAQLNTKPIHRTIQQLIADPREPGDVLAQFITPDPKTERVKEARELLRIARGSELIIISDEVKHEALIDALNLILDLVSE